MSDHIDRAAKVLDRHLDPLRLDDGETRMLAEALDAAGPLASPKHDAAVAARAWDEGHTAGVRNASAEFDGPVQDNPYEREGGAS